MVFENKINNRKHVIYFRITELEYQGYLKLVQQVGARNISDLARMVLNRMPIDSELDKLKELVARLEKL